MHRGTQQPSGSAGDKAGPTPPAPAAPALHPLLIAPILPTLLRLALPNTMAMLATALVAIAETAYVGRLGTPALAGMALVFPMVMLQQMMSAGAMGGGVSSAISRALGAGEERRARLLAFHAVAIGSICALAFTVLFLTCGPAIYRLLGGHGDMLREAIAYSNVLFAGLTGIWLTNTLASIVRGGGNMKIPSATLLAVAALQVALGSGFGLGLGPFPRFGMAGVALGQVLAYAAGALFLAWFLWSGHARVALQLGGMALQRDMLHDILKVGALACVSPLQTVLTILILTGLVASFGPEALAGYGIGARLEFLLVPITFAIGVACVPMIGMAIGAGDASRARRIAWTAGALSSASLGTVGLLVALAPDLWAALFTDDAAVISSARMYLTFSGPGYAFFGLGLCLYFASQGAGKVLGPVLTGTLRLFVVAGGGWLLMRSGAPQWTIFALVSAAMIVYGIATAAAIYWTPWGKR